MLRRSGIGINKVITEVVLPGTSITVLDMHIE